MARSARRIIHLDQPLAPAEKSRSKIELRVPYARLVLLAAGIAGSLLFRADIEPFRGRFLVIALCFLPLAVLAVRPIRGMPTTNMQFAGDLLAFVLVQFFVPTIRVAVLLGYGTLVAVRTVIAGRTAGFTTALAAVMMTIGVEVLRPFEPGIAPFTILVFAGVTIASVALLEGAKVFQRIQDTQGMRERVAALSHELRTPLTSIAGFAGTLETRWDQIGDKDRHELLRRITDNAQQMNVLTERLIDYAADERSLAGTDRTVVDLHDVVTDYCETHAPSMRGHPMIIEIPAGIRVAVSPGAIDRVFGNLLSNAVKFSPEAAPISVTAIPLRSEVVVSVRDQGEGIPLGEADQIFEPFYQSRQRRARGGAGIGLALVREYVERHGGRVWAESVPGGGATFVFTLPRHKSSTVRVAS